MEAAIDRLRVIRSARALGFGVREIRTLIDNGRPATSISDRWRGLARRKLPELEALIGRATKMKQLLESGLACSCVRIEDCILHECKSPVIAAATLTRRSSAGPFVPPGAPFGRNA
jgi:DNA-binding transcriptional MerR regulator